MAVFGILTKMAYLKDGAIWVSFITYLAGTLVLLPFVGYLGIDFLKSAHYPALLGRAIFGCAASFLYMLSMLYIPIVNATLLFNTAPIFIPLLAMFFLKVHIARNIWFAIVLGFLGIIIIVKPTSDILTKPGNLIGLASGISLAVAYLLIKILSATETKLRIVFYYLCVGALIQVPLLLFAGPLPVVESCAWAALSGIVLVLAQVALVEAYSLAEASQVGVYQYSTIVFVGLMDWLIWGIVPSLFDLFGVILVVLAGILIIRQKSVNN